MRRILVMCTGNSCRSQMAQGYLTLFANSEAEIYSAGIETHGVNENAIKVMQEEEVDISHHTSNAIDEYLDIDFDLVITVCDHAQETCPIFPKAVTTVHKNFNDPTKMDPSGDDGLKEFRKTRDEIREFCQELIGDFLFNE